MASTMFEAAGNRGANRVVTVKMTFVFTDGEASAARKIRDAVRSRFLAAID